MYLSGYKTSFCKDNMTLHDIANHLDYTVSVDGKVYVIPEDGYWWAVLEDSHPLIETVKAHLASIPKTYDWYLAPKTIYLIDHNLIGKWVDGRTIICKKEGQHGR